MGWRALRWQWVKETKSTQRFESPREDDGDAGSFVHGVFRNIYLVRGDSAEPQAAAGGDACRSHGRNAGGSTSASTSATGDIGRHSGRTQCNQWGYSDSADLDQYGEDGAEQAAAVGGMAATADQSGPSASHADDRAVPQPDEQHLPHKAQQRHPAQPASSRGRNPGPPGEQFPGFDGDVCKCLRCNPGCDRRESRGTAPCRTWMMLWRSII